MMGVALAVAGVGFASAQTEDGPTFPVTPEIFVDEPFTSAEGITFNAEGRMFVSANKAVWEVGLDRSARKLFDTDSNLGLAAYGERDILVADFGPTNAFQDDRNADGVVWLSTPEGEKVAFATGIGDPNAIVVRDDGSLLVSDDATADIYLVSPEGKSACSRPRSATRTGWCCPTTSVRSTSRVFSTASAQSSSTIPFGRFD